MLTPLAVSALALLNEHPMHPYEMYQTLLERHKDRIVKVRPGSLYHTVERLHAANLVEIIGTRCEGNRPERTTYAITDAGRSALVGRIREMLQVPVNEYPQLPVALSEAHNEPAEIVVEDLRAYAKALAEQNDTTAELVSAARADGISDAYLIGGDYVKAILGAQHDWITDLITRIETKDLPWPHPTT